MIATGEQRSVRDFLATAAEAAGIELRFEGTGLDEVGLDGNGRKIVEINERYLRPAEVESLLGDASLAREKLGRKPRVSFENLVREVMSSDMAEAERSARRN